MFHWGNQLRSVERICSDNISEINNLRLIILEHILPTTAEYIRVLNSHGIEIEALIGKPYSVDNGSLNKIKELNINVIIKKDYNEIENSDLLTSILDKAFKKSKKDNKYIVIIDVGGYFAKPLSIIKDKYNKYLVGIVEDTTFGHNRYLNALKKEEICVPIFSVARSELKKIEAIYVGRDAVASMDRILRHTGITLSGRNALVIGYGMIGSNVARTLRRYDLNVSVYDIEDRRNLVAYNDGYKIHKKNTLLTEADIIFSATGSEAIHNKVALTLHEIEDYCRQNVILASVGSRDTEFDIQEIQKVCVKKETYNKHLQRFESQTASKGIIVVNNGTAVNFIEETIPIEVLDLVFSEITMCVVALLSSLKEPNKYIASNIIYSLQDNQLDIISKEWLRSVNMSKP